MPNELKPCCPYCGEELRMFGTHRMKYAVAHRCESGLKIEISSRKKKEILEILEQLPTHPNQEDLAEATDIIQRVYLYQKTKRSHTRPVEDMPTNKELESFLSKRQGGS